MINIKKSHSVIILQYYNLLLHKLSQFDVLLIIDIFTRGSSVTVGDFPSRFLKCSFYMCIRSSGLVTFSLPLKVHFLLLTSFAFCHSIRNFLSSTEFRILMIWSWMYSVCSFTYAVVSTVSAFINCWAMAFVGFLLQHRNVVFTLLRFFFLIANVSQGILFSSQFDWYAFYCYVHVTIDEVLIFIISDIS